jgi:hypothetical protein
MFYWRTRGWIMKYRDSHENRDIAVAVAKLEEGGNIIF